MKNLFRGLGFLFLSILITVGQVACAAFQKPSTIAPSACVAQCIDAEVTAYLGDSESSEAAETVLRVVTQCTQGDADLKAAGKCALDQLGPDAADVGAAVALCVVSSCPEVL